jgi:hypothetical protein
MIDILQLRVNLDAFDQLRLCQTEQRIDCHAAFTVKGTETIWPSASWADTAPEERVNVRGWFPLLDQIADEFLIFRPEGGCFFVYRESVRYRLEDGDSRGVVFMRIEINRLVAVASRQADVLRTYLLP